MQIAVIRSLRGNEGVDSCGLAVEVVGDRPLLVERRAVGIRNVDAARSERQIRERADAVRRRDSPLDACDCDRSRIAETATSNRRARWRAADAGTGDVVLPVALDADVARPTETAASSE